MIVKQIEGLNKVSGLRMTGAIVTLLIIAVFFSWWTVARADREMRAELLLQTQLAAKSVDLKLIQSLSGTESDINKPNYLLLKKQLSTLRGANPNYRFIYLLGCKANGKVFFFVDDQPVGHKDESPAGMIYNEASNELRSAFITKNADIEGPIADQWGEFVTGFVPITDPSTGAVIAVLGMDINAKDWKLDVAARSALPIGMMLVLLIGVVTALALTSRVDTSPKPVLWRLLPPLTTIVVILITSTGALMWFQYQQEIASHVANLTSETRRVLQITLEQQVEGLIIAAQTISADITVKQALGARDSDRLLTVWQPLFATLHRDQNLTHLYFVDARRTCILRVHQPETRGDIINRFTIQEAEKTGKVAYGIELGELGNLTLRVVQPVFDNGTRVGYIELGKEIEDVLQVVHERANFEMAVTIHKEHLKRQDWEASMKPLGREADWDNLSNCVVIYASQGRLPEHFSAWADHVSANDNALSKTNQEIAFNGKHWGVSAAPLTDASGAAIGDLLLMRDITAENASLTRLLALGGTGGMVALALLMGFIYVLLRRTDAGIQAQQAKLSDSEEKHRLLFEHAISAVAIHEVILDATGRPVDYILLSVNPAFETQTGLHTADVLNRRITEVIPGIERTPLIEIYGKVALGGEPAAFEHYSEQLGRHFSINAYQLSDKRFATLFTDITERKQAEERLRESEERLRALTESAQDAIIMMDPKGAITYWNPAAEVILGYRPEEAIGKNLHRLLSPERYLDAHKAAYPEFLRSGSGKAVGKTLDLEARRKDGQEISVSLSLSSVALKEEWHAVGIIRDITEQKQTEKEILETNKQLEKTTALANKMAAQAEMANIAKSEFLANMSHEIRTPMNGVIGMTGLLLDSPLNNEQRRFAEIVRASGESLLALINDILDFSKIEAGKLDLETLNFDLTSMLDDFAATLAVKAYEKNIEFICAADPEVPELLRGDPGRLRQVLTNLTGNAVKFTNAGEVSVRVSLVKETENNVLLRFSVRDTGIGIPKDKIGLLFNKFSQVDSSTTRKYGGSGLGLVISKQLAELMGGEAGVESEEGKGSEFWFTAVFSKQQEKSPAKNLPPTDLRGIRILIVDDNATNREILTTRLSSWGMRSAEARNGNEALQALYLAQEKNDPFAIAVIDMLMPGMNGETLCRKIKADARLAETRVVMLTSMGIRGDARRFEEMGFAAYANKPLRHQELKAVLSLTMRQATEPMPKAIATRHSAREMGSRFEGCKARILLVEDNIINQRVALGILKKLGLRADAVANGAEAIKALETIPYDLVLMDVQMPVMDGFEATRLIRNSQSAIPDRQVHIIAMTAHAMQGDREKCLEVGMNDYIPKPISLQSLAEILDKWLPE